MTIRPIGTFSQKIHGQARPCTTAPPIIGPARMARPTTPLKIPSAFARWGGGYAPDRRAMAGGMIIAEPAPCTARATISQPMDGASAHAADIAVNSPRPSRNSRRRPNRSPTAEAVISSTAKLSV